MPRTVSTALAAALRCAICTMRGWLSLRLTCKQPSSSQPERWLTQRQPLKAQSISAVNQRSQSAQHTDLCCAQARGDDPWCAEPRRELQHTRALHLPPCTEGLLGWNGWAMHGAAATNLRCVRHQPLTELTRRWPYLSPQHTSLTYRSPTALECAGGTRGHMCGMQVACHPRPPST